MFQDVFRKILWVALPFREKLAVGKRGHLARFSDVNLLLLRVQQGIRDPPPCSGRFPDLLNSLILHLLSPPKKTNKQTK